MEPIAIVGRNIYAIEIAQRRAFRLISGLLLVGMRLSVKKCLGAVYLRDYKK